MNQGVALRTEVWRQELDSKSRVVGRQTVCLGDHRLFYTARATDHLQHYVRAHHGLLIVPALRITDEPYGQEEAVRVWGKQVVDVSKQVDWC